MTNAIDRLEEMEGRATGGVWAVNDQRASGWMDNGVYIIGGKRNFVRVYDEFNDKAVQDANAALISALRNAAKPLLAVVRAGEEVRYLHSNSHHADGRLVTADERWASNTKLDTALATLKETTL